MSLVTKGIGIVKKLKHKFDDEIKARAPVYISPVRRIERVSLNKRVCVMTFDDGPCRLPANPNDFGDKSLTEVIIETLERHGARGTFDVIGDTSGNYPDVQGKSGTAAWGGVRFDHYPDFEKDSDGGVLNCGELVSRMLEGGHQITSHTWRHILWGQKNLVYGKRTHLSSIDQVLEDLGIMHRTLSDKWGYEISCSRPPHYVDNISGGYTSYDVYAAMGYQYMAASFDGAGWLPLASYDAEVDAMVRPLESALSKDPDALCGQIIFQKDGYNMAHRSPVAHGLEKQLQILDSYGYKVITLDELLSMSSFRDADPEKAADAQALLEDGWCVAFKDNSLRLETPLTEGALYQMAYGWEGALKRIELIKEKRTVMGLKPSHPYSGAYYIAAERLGIGGKAAPDAAASARQIENVLTDKLGNTPDNITAPMTHGEFFRLCAEVKAKALQV